MKMAATKAILQHVFIIYLSLKERIAADLARLLAMYGVRN
jgi:hypothetical protein